MLWVERCAESVCASQRSEMARRRRGPTLIELIDPANSAAESEKPTAVPGWWRGSAQESPAVDQPVPKPAPADVSEESDLVLAPLPQEDASTDADDTSPSGHATVPVTPLTLAVAVLGVLVVATSAYYVGRGYGRAERLTAGADGAAASPLETLIDEKGLDTSGEARIPPRPGPMAPAVTDPADAAAFERLPPGDYLCIQDFNRNRKHAIAAWRWLEGQGIATRIHMNRSRYHLLSAEPCTKLQLAKIKAQFEKLGRKYSASGGGYKFQGAYRETVREE